MRVFLVDNQMYTLSASWKEIMLKRSWSKIGIYDMTWLIMRLGNPFGELHGIRDRRGQKHVTDLVRQENDGFFPYDAAS